MLYVVLTQRSDRSLLHAMVISSLVFMMDGLMVCGAIFVLELFHLGPESTTTYVSQICFYSAQSHSVYDTSDTD
jgi:hypothetical protein